MSSSLVHLAVTSLVLASFAVVCSQDRPAYVKPCKSDDPKISQCFTGSLYHLAPYMAKGIPEIELPPVEPYRMKELSLSLTSGPNGYKITLRDIDITGLTNFTIRSLKLSKNGSPFEVQLKFPNMQMHADYTSSGVLLIIPASGGGVFYCTLGDTVAKVKGKVSFTQKNGKEYMKVDSLDMDFTFNKVAMRVEKAHRNNPILREATNLFLRENGNEVVELMKPQLSKQLVNVALDVTNIVLKHTPIDLFYEQSS